MYFDKKNVIRPYTPDAQNKEGGTQTLNSLFCNALQMIITLECLFLVLKIDCIMKACALLLSIN